MLDVLFAPVLPVFAGVALDYSLEWIARRVVKRLNFPPAAEAVRTYVLLDDPLSYFQIR